MKRLQVGVGIALIAAVVGSGVVFAQQRNDRPRKQEKPPKLIVNLKEKLKFMAGCWYGKMNDEITVEEIWNSPTENLMTSTTRYIKKDRAVSYEFSRIVATDSAVTFAASSEGKPFNEYKMTKLIDEYVVFENKAKEFPNLISYRLASDGSLIPRNEGENRPSVEVVFKKGKCPGT